jgi:RND family efflux transporter MFP subunit
MTRQLLLLTVLLTITACGERIEPGQTADQPAAVSGLATTLVEPVPVPARYALPGTLESTDRGLLSARISGQVARILVDKGQVVKAGETLLTLSGETASSDLHSATAAMTAAERHLAEAETSLELAEATYARFLKLRDARAVTPYEFDQVKAERDASRAQRSSARTMADQATVRAPYAATVAEILVDAGSTVQPGSPLLHLDRSGPLLVRVALPESLATRHQLGDHFQVELPALDKELTGTLAELLPTADPGSRTITAWLSLPEDPALKNGLFARVLLPEGAGMTTLMIPLQAVITRGQLTGVYVVENDILHYRLVRTGTVHGEQVEILSGVQAGEEIVAGELARARHGARLERN